MFWQPLKKISVDKKVNKMKKIKKFLRNFILTRHIYLFLHELFHGFRSTRHKFILRKTLQQNGEETVRAIQEMLDSTGVFFFFDMGTLLGIIREGRLLRHDMDIDVAVFTEDASQKESLKQTLLAKGCTLRYSYSVEELGVVEDSFVYNDIKFDINYFSEVNGMDVCYLMYTDPNKGYPVGKMSVVQLMTPHISALKKIDFGGCMINVPEDPEKYLAARYGENWRIPDKNYIYWKGPSTSPTDYIGTVYQP